MRLLLKETCCCGVDLKLGGLIVACLSLGFCSLDLFYAIGKGASFIDFIGEAVITAAVIACIYGIHKNKYRCMVPHLTILWIALFFMGLLLITIPFSGSFTDERIEEILKEYKNMLRHFNIEVTGAFLTIVWISIAVMTAINLYFLIVLQSVYKLIKGYGRELLPTTDRCEFTGQAD